MAIRRSNSKIPRRTLQGRSVEEQLDEFERPELILRQPFDVNKCTVQPYTGDRLALSSDGFQGKDIQTIFTETELTSGLEASNRKADEVLINSRYYKVVKVKPWQVGVIPHYECIVVEIDEGLI